MVVVVSCGLFVLGGVMLVRWTQVSVAGGRLLV